MPTDEAEHRGYDRAIAEVVAWLRSESDDIAPPETEGSDPLWTAHAFVHKMADAIEAGEHKP